LALTAKKIILHSATPHNGCETVSKNIMPKTRSTAPASAHAADNRFMAECLVLAVKGKGHVTPNPLVGSVIVVDGKIIGKGYHQRYGDAHAEVNAIFSVKDEKLFRKATLYVNLEPCSHFGNTPPCADLIIEKKIPRVVVGCLDPNPVVSGKGIAKLEAAGVQVTIGILETESQRLNEIFLTFHSQKRPFVALKLAQTLDGKIATKDFDSKWVTGEAARKAVHALRASYDAVLVGTTTSLKDNPSLTVRDAAGNSPVRVVLDRTLKIPITFSVLADRSAETMVFTSAKNVNSKKAAQLKTLGIKVFSAGETNGLLNLKDILSVLYREKIQSVLVEGGGSVFSSFVREQLADKLYAFIAPKLVGADGISSVGKLGLSKIADAVQLKHLSVSQIDEDVLIEGYF
jgi:diaminohydroxyphosphoribosylaminopyrimidine deaminase/5-amino-6-(5-phosphoribosylamino)uracil reductase